MMQYPFNFIYWIYCNLWKEVESPSVAVREKGSNTKLVVDIISSIAFDLAVEPT